jgi:cell division protein FtsL
MRLFQFFTRLGRLFNELFLKLILLLVYLIGFGIVFMVYRTILLFSKRNIDELERESFWGETFRNHFSPFSSPY